MNVARTTNTLVTKLQDVFEREITTYEIALVDWIVHQIHLQQLEENK